MLLSDAAITKEKDTAIASVVNQYPANQLLLTPIATTMSPNSL